MANLLILEPAPIFAAEGGMPSAVRILTRNPKEAWFVAPSNAGQSIDIDLGSEKVIDTFYLGYLQVRLGSDQAWTVQVTTGIGTGAAGVISTLFDHQSLSDGLGQIGVHSFFRVAPTPARYLRVIIHNPPGNPVLAAGVFATGAGMSLQWGQEFGAGRTIGDTSTVERLFGGSFGIDEGVIFGGYQWTFGDIQPEELQALWASVRRLGSSRTVLVVEDPDRTAGLNDRIHWGLFDRIEPYEREDPKNSRWSFRIWDWA